MQVMVGEHSVSQRRVVVRLFGGIRREDAGMSNERGDKNLLRRKSKDSYATLYGVGLVGT